VTLVVWLSWEDFARKDSVTPDRVLRQSRGFLTVPSGIGLRASEVP
jgi:hypothetical protein